MLELFIVHQTLIFVYVLAITVAIVSHLKVGATIKEMFLYNAIALFIAALWKKLFKKKQGTND